MNLRLGWVAFGVFSGAVVSGVLLMEPSVRGDWAAEFAVPVRSAQEGDKLILQNLRDFSWAPSGPNVRYRGATLNLAHLKTLWLAVSPLSKTKRGPAHLMLSFRFDGGETITISAEARRRAGERYSPWRGLRKRYPLTYVVSTERDAMTRRTQGRGADVFLYPVKADPAAVRRLFEEMLARAEQLETRPEYYNTLTNNCAQNIRRHVNRLVDRPFGRSWRFILPGYLDEEAAARGLLAVAGPLSVARSRCRVDPRLGNEPDFSERIREHLPRAEGAF